MSYSEYTDTDRRKWRQDLKAHVEMAGGNIQRGADRWAPWSNLSDSDIADTIKAVYGPEDAAAYMNRHA